MLIVTPSGRPKRFYGLGRSVRATRDTPLGSTPMCSKAGCHVCGLTTWSGCGAHVEQVMRGVPVDQRCTCDDAAPLRDLRERRSLTSRLRRLIGR